MSDPLSKQAMASEIAGAVMSGKVKAVAVVEQWKFKPATMEGKPVDVQIQIVVNFHLY